MVRVTRTPLRRRRRRRRFKLANPRGTPRRKIPVVVFFFVECPPRWVVSISCRTVKNAGHARLPGSAMDSRETLAVRCPSPDKRIADSVSDPAQSSTFRIAEVVYNDFQNLFYLKKIIINVRTRDEYVFKRITVTAALTSES